MIHRRKQHPTQAEEDREEEALRREECPECGRSVRDLERHRLNVHTPAKTEAAARLVETAVPFFGKSTVVSFDFLSIIYRKLSRTACAEPTCGKEFATAYAARYHFEKFHGEAAGGGPER